MNSKGATNTTLIIIVVLVVVFLGLIVLLGGGCYLISRMAKNADTASQETKSGWLTYKNSQWNYSIKYPETYSKEESANGDGATFTSTSPKIEIRSFAVLSNDQSADQYLLGILSLARESIITKSVTEIASSSQNLGDIPGTMKIWVYDIGGKKSVELRLAASNGSNMYNLSMTIDSLIYQDYLPTFKEMAATFSAQI
jgi:hypothetical protein